MRRFAVAALLLFGTSFTAAFSAGAPDALFRGTSGQAWTRNNASYCSTDIGPTLFQRSGTDQALISFPTIQYAVFDGTTPTNAPTYYTLSGTARLFFSTAHGGRIKFDQPTGYPTEILQPRFSRYAEHYNAALGRLVVTFQILFDGCTVNVDNTYWN